ncbi:hypothetical protein [Aliarcobacter butzleri]|uniref:hypothetical protein n=1 Tax=Aliarcobacter butzleri TaxID=28197 RepID=UPI0021B1B97D|nr:hypothetical protein [Aliarcobacter butzleri]MCT7647638.1 hypothetical protein [Aliarcobacter butzleri]
MNKPNLIINKKEFLSMIDGYEDYYTIFSKVLKSLETEKSVKITADDILKSKVYIKNREEILNHKEYKGTDVLLLTECIGSFNLIWE